MDNFISQCRSCQVVVNGTYSEKRGLTLSVPQGGCGSAFYFIMYAATLFEEISDDINCFGFADDHILNNHFEPNSRLAEANAAVDMESCLADVQHWMNGVKLKMNPEKTEFIYFGYRSQLQNFMKIKRICQFLTKDACETLVLGLVISHLYYSNNMLVNTSDCTLAPYQRLQNMCAKLVLNSYKYGSSLSALKDLHWLPVRARIHFKILSQMHQCTYHPI